MGKVVIKIIRDRQVFDLMEEPEFIHSWNQLAGADPKFTLLQEPFYVAPWYTHYQQKYEPVLICGHIEAEKLVGLLPLAFHREDQYLTHVGDIISEYHGWVAHPEYNEEFVLEALIQVKYSFNINGWEWYWLPANCPHEWLESKRLRQHGIHPYVVQGEIPIWGLTDQSKLKRVLKRKNVKRSYKQYRRRGKLFLELITDPERIRAMLPVFEQQVDFKKKALFDVRPFQQNPELREVLPALQSREAVNHFSVLWLDDKPLAFNHGFTVGKKMILAGWTSYDPSEGKHSPGKLQLIELARLLTEQGYEGIDLSPGEHAYKARYATQWEPTRKVFFYTSRFGCMKKKYYVLLRQKGYTLFDKWGWNIDQAKILKAEIRNFMKQLRRGRIKKLRDFFWLRKTFEIYQLKGFLGEWIEEMRTSSSKLGEQQYEDLMVYEGQYPYQTQKALLSEALKRFSAGERLYSSVKEGTLQFFAWMKESKGETLVKQVPIPALPPGSRIFYDFTSVDNKELPVELIENTLSQMLASCWRENANEIYLVRESQDPINSDIRRQFSMKQTAVFSYLRMMGLIKVRQLRKLAQPEEREILPPQDQLNAVNRP